MRRGRPPYPDVLTPREQEVLALIRDGLTNDQIAARLGISESGARYHVSEILSKLGVASRHEAAHWAGQIAASRRFRLSLPHLSPMLLVGGAVATGLVAFVGLAVGVLIMDAREDEPTDTQAKGVYAIDQRTGVDAIDHVLDLIERQEWDALTAEAYFTPSPCTSSPSVGFPQCAPGESPGTPHEVFAWGSCQPSLATSRSSLTRYFAGAFTIQFPYAAFEVDSDLAPAAQYLLLLRDGVQVSDRQVYIDSQGRLVATFECGAADWLPGPNDRTILPRPF